MPTAGIRNDAPAFRVRNDYPAARIRGTSGSYNIGGTNVESGTPIGLLLALTYANAQRIGGTTITNSLDEVFVRIRNTD